MSRKLTVTLAIARVILAILLAAGWGSRIHADTISVFSITGTAVSSCLFVPEGTPIPGCSPTSEGFAGALVVDVTSGNPLAMSVLVPGFNEFSVGLGFIGVGGVLPPIQNVGLAVGNDRSQLLQLFFTTPTPGSLVGFDGGTFIEGLPIGAGSAVYDSSSVPLEFVQSGSITLVAAPEPSAFALMLLGFGLIGLLVSFRRKVPVSA